MPSESVIKARLASGQACTSCRKRKNRCDGARPSCMGCQSRRIACEYPSTPVSQFSVEELKMVMEAKLRGMAGSRANIHDANFDEEQTGRPASDSEQGAESLSLDTPLIATTDLLGPSSSHQSISSVDSSARRRTATTESFEGGDIEESSSIVSISSESEKPDGYFGDSSTFAFVSMVQPEPVVEVEQPFAYKRPRLSSPSRSHASIEGLNFGQNSKDHDECFVLPPGGLADRLVDAYFNHVHPLYPFVHEPSFRAKYERARGHSQGGHLHSRLSWLGILNLIFAYGCEFCLGVSKEDVLPMTTRFVSRAKDIIFPHMSREGSLEMVQALLLLCHHLQGTLDSNECWNLVGLMIRTAVGIGLPFKLSKGGLTSVENEIRKRVWWGCFVIDRTVSMKYGRPPSIRAMDEFEVDFPVSVDDQYITNDSIAPRQPDGRPSIIDFFLHTIKLSYIMDSVLQDLYRPQKSKLLNQTGRQVGSRSNQSQVLGTTVHLDGELLLWWQGVPPHLRYVQDVEGLPDFQRQRNVMYIRFLNVRLLLHRQAFLIFSRQDIDDTFHRAVAIASAQTCVSSACETIRLIHTQYHRGLLNSLWYNLHYVFTAIGVLLTLQTMEKTRVAYLNQDYQEALGWGMEFLKAASSTNMLAARYLTILQRLSNSRKIPNRGNYEDPQPRNEIPAVHDDREPDMELPYTDEMRWLPIDQYDYEGIGFQPAFGFQFLDYNDLFSSPGLSSDLIANK